MLSLIRRKQTVEDDRWKAIAWQAVNHNIGTQGVQGVAALTGLLTDMMRLIQKGLNLFHRRCSLQNVL